MFVAGREAPLRGGKKGGTAGVGLSSLWTRVFLLRRLFRFPILNKRLVVALEAPHP